MVDEIVATITKGALQVTGQPSGAKAETTPVEAPKTPKTYTEDELVKRVSDSLAEAGRKHKLDIASILKERDTFKSEASQAKKEAENATATLNDTKAGIEALESDLATLSETNPDSADIIKLKKEIRTEKSKLASEARAEKEALAELRKTLEKERDDFAGEISEARTMKFEVDVVEVAKEFEGGDVARLKTLCEKAGKLKRSEVEDIAAVLWAKKGAKAEDAIVLKTDSGVTNGGSTRTRFMIQSDYANSKINLGQYVKEMAAHGFRID